MNEERLRRRTRLRRKEAQEVTDGVNGALGHTLFAPEDPLESAEYREWQLLLKGQAIVCLLHQGKAFPTVRTLLGMPTPPQRRYVEVDQGAIRFVTNGADVMAPGVVAADAGIVVGDLVYVREAAHHKALAVGIALVEGSKMKGGGKGKVVTSLHYLGDRLWTLEA